MVKQLKDFFSKTTLKADVKFPEIQKVTVENQSEIEIPEQVSVKNLKEISDALSEFSKQIVDAINSGTDKTTKELKPEKREKLATKLDDIIKVLSRPVEQQDVVGALSSLQKVLEDKDLSVDLKPVLDKLDSFDFNVLEPYTKYGEVKTRLNEKQLEKLVEAMKKSFVASSSGSGTIKDGSGNPYSSSNPLPVSMSSDFQIGAVEIKDATTTNRATVDWLGRLKTRTAFERGTEDSFAHLITGSVHNDIDIQFYRDTVANLTTVTTANGGTASATGGMATFTTAAQANSQAKGVSLTSTRYTAGAEMYALFTAAFTGTPSANTYQRIGLYDDNDGFFIGYEGTSFGVTVRKGGSDTSVAQASFSEDDLTGSATSEFTRATTPEAIDLTKLNVYRIRFGWVGSAPITFEVLSPDGEWVQFHTIHQPNLAAVPSLENADLPVTADVTNGADTNIVAILSNCWGAGTTQSLLPIDENISTSSFAPLVRSVIAGETTAGGGAFVNVKVNPSGTLETNSNQGTDPWNVDVTANSIGLATAANQSTIIGHVDGIEGLLGTIDTDTGNIATNTSTIAGDTTSLDSKVTACNTGAVVIATNTDSIDGPGTPTVDSYTTAAVNLAANTANQSVITAPGANKQIWVYGLVGTADVAGSISIQDEDDTALSGVMPVAATGGFVMNPSGNFAMPWIKVATNKALEIDTVTCTFDGTITYAIVSV